MPICRSKKMFSKHRYLITLRVVAHTLFFLSQVVVTNYIFPDQSISIFFVKMLRWLGKNNHHVISSHGMGVLSQS